MIKEVKGDILLSGAEAIAQSVAPLDHFDSGLALSLRTDYPSMYKDFRHFCHTHSPKTGETWVWQGADHKKIINLLIQEPSDHGIGHPGAATLSNLRHAIKGLSKEISKNKITSLALPKIATGVGGLDWEDVYPIIHEHLDPLDCNIYVYTTYTKGEKAEE